MNKRRIIDKDYGGLRHSAEQSMTELDAHKRSDDGDTLKLLHELQVYQIELELQNNTLQAARYESETSLKRYQRLYDYAPVGYFSVDKLGFITDINLTGANMLGFERSQLIGKCLAPFFTNSDLFLGHLINAISQGKNVDIELKLKNSAGQLLDVRLESRAADNVDTPGFINTILTDISNRKGLERKLRQQCNDLQFFEQKQVVIQTVSALAHELNQPLTAISMFSEVAIDYLKNAASEPAHLLRPLTAMVEQVGRAGEILHGLFDYLQNSEIYTEAINLNNLVRDTIVVMHNCGFGEFQPILCLEPDLMPVQGNLVHVQKTLINLLRNSVDAVVAAGVAMAAITITVRTNNEWNMAQVTITDNSPGLDWETAKHIFDPFFSTKPHGIGLGLSISRALIEANGGQLWVEPNGSGDGSIFHFTLPFAAQQL